MTECHGSPRKSQGRASSRLSGTADHKQTACAALMVGAGFVTYYLIPYAFVFRDIPLFLGLLTGILLGMLFGLADRIIHSSPYSQKTSTSGSRSIL